MLIDNTLQKDLIQYNKEKRFCFNNSLEFEENPNFEKFLKARYNKISRIKQHFVYLICCKKYHYFITFTFNENFIKKCDRTKRDYIKRSLSSFSNEIFYILNIDFGSKKEREHFHCIVGTNNNSNLKTHLENTYCKDTDSFIWCESIRIQTQDIKRISKYINKLSNHCCKDSTKNRRIVYNFKSYESIPSPLGSIKYILDCDKLGL